MSDSDSLREVGHRIGDLAVDSHLEVKVRAEAEASAVADPDHLALAHVLALADGEARLVRVAGRDPAPVVDAGEVAVAAARGLGLGELHDPVGGGVDRRAARHPDVDAGVAAFPWP